MTHHPRPPLFDPARAMSNDEKIERMAKFDAEILGAYANPKRIEDATLEDALERGGTFGNKIGAGKTARWSATARSAVTEPMAAEYGSLSWWRSVHGEVASDFAPPATVADITGPGMDP